MRSILPSQIKRLKPHNDKEVQKTLRKAKEEQQRQHDKGTRPLRPLKRGEKVYTQPYGQNRQWQSAIVCERLENRRYKIKLDNGRILFRNRRHLRPRGAPNSEKLEGHRHFIADDTGATNDAYGGSDGDMSIVQRENNEQNDDTEHEPNNPNRDNQIENETEAEHGTETIPNIPQDSLRRSQRSRRPPERFKDYFR